MIVTKGLGSNLIISQGYGYSVGFTVITVPRSKGGRTRKIIDDRLPRLLREDREILELVIIITVTGTLED